MLDQSEILMGFAGLAITLIGFTGIVVVFGTREQGGWTREDRQKLTLLILPSLTVFFCAVLPIVLAESGLDTSLTWRISNGVFALAHISNMGWFFLNPIKAQKAKAQNWHLSHGLLSIALKLLAAAGLAPWLVAIYIFALVQQLGISILNFYLLLMPRLVSDEERNE